MRHAFNDQPHFAFENVDDLLLWMRMRWHLTPRRQCGEHLIHRVAVCDRPAGDPGTNFNRRAFRFHIENITWAIEIARMVACSKLALVTPQSWLAISNHENFYITNNNCVCSADSCSFVRAKSRTSSRHITGQGYRRSDSSSRSAESAGDVEADGGDGETQPEPQTSLHHGRQLDLQHQDVDEPRPERQAAGIKRYRQPQERYGRSLCGDGCHRQNADAGSKRQNARYAVQGHGGRR